MNPYDPAPDIHLILRSLPGETHDAPRLRRALKYLRRTCGLRCLKVEWVDREPQPNGEDRSMTEKNEEGW